MTAAIPTTNGQRLARPDNGSINVSFGLMSMSCMGEGNWPEPTGDVSIRQPPRQPWSTPSGRPSKQASARLHDLLECRPQPWILSRRLRGPGLIDVRVGPAHLTPVARTANGATPR